MTTLHRLFTACAFACALAVPTLIGIAPAAADKRVALVIGNATYRNVPSLANPANDARLMADTLRELGFTLIGGGAQIDLDKPAIDTAVRSFGNQLQGADVGLFYYAGHGVQVRGANYLVPVNANPTREADVDYELGDLALVLRQMEAAGTRLNLVILDACRNNPFGGRGLRATDPGLAQMRAPEGTLISFATQPGNVAQDGGDGNSPYTRALAQTIRQPGLGIFDAINEVGLVVKRATGGAQQPWFSTSPIDGRFFFAAPQPAPAVSPQTARSSEAERAWAVTRDTTSQAVLEDFIRQFSDTAYGSMARARLDELKKSQVAVVAPPVVPPAVETTPKPAVVAPPALPGAPCGSDTVGVALSLRPACPLSAAEERGLKPKDTFKECDSCPQMVVVPQGSFTMGSPENELGHDKVEGPQHNVTFGRPFAVGKFEVTVDQFAAFVKTTGYEEGSKCFTAEGGGNMEDRSGRSWRNPGYAQNGAHPAACVSWNDAKAYVGWLGKSTGKDYRLLTEAEWEYAARARTTPGAAPPYSFGDDESTMCVYGNGADQTAFKVNPDWKGLSFTCDDGYAYTAPVGTFAPNSFNLHDMHGNVWEWTEDCYHDSYKGAPTNGSAWTGGACKARIVRGGGWRGLMGDLRSAARGIALGSDYRGYFVGFRVARTLPAPPPADTLRGRGGLY